MKLEAKRDREWVSNGVKGVKLDSVLISLRSLAKLKIAADKTLCITQVEEW